MDLTTPAKNRRKMSTIGTNFQIKENNNPAIYVALFEIGLQNHRYKAWYFVKCVCPNSYTVRSLRQETVRARADEKCSSSSLLGGHARAPVLSSIVAVAPSRKVMNGPPLSSSRLALCTLPFFLENARRVTSWARRVPVAALAASLTRQARR